MHLIELLKHENLYFATNFVRLSALKQKLCSFIDFGGCLGGHLGGHLGFTNLDMPEVILMCLIGLLIYENLYFAINFIQLSALG